MFIALTLEQIRALACGFVSMLIYGSSYTYGTLVPYFISYIYYNSDPSITSNQFSILLPLSVTVLTSAMPLGLIPQLQFSNRMTILISVIGISVAVFLVSLANQLWHYLVMYGFIFGVFIGYGYLAPMKNCYDHIPERKGLCSGVCKLGYGIASLLFNYVIQFLVNPRNQSVIVLEDKRRVYSLQVANNLPVALKIMALIYLVIGLLGVLLVKAPEVEPGAEKLGEAEGEGEANKDYPQIKNQPLMNDSKDQSKESNKDNELYLKAQEDEKMGGSVISYILQKKIYFLNLTLTFLMPFGYFIAYNYKEYGSLKITDDDSFLTTVGSVGAVFNGFGRLIFGMLFDLFSFRFLSIIINVVLLVLSLTFSLLVQNKYLYLVAVALLYFVYGANFSIYPTQTIRVFGGKIGAKVYFLVYFGFTFASLIQYFVRNIIVQENNKYEGYKTCFYIFAGCNAVSLLLILFVKYDYEEDIHKSKKEEIEGAKNFVQ